MAGGNGPFAEALVSSVRTERQKRRGGLGRGYILFSNAGIDARHTVSLVLINPIDNGHSLPLMPRGVYAAFAKCPAVFFRLLSL